MNFIVTQSRRVRRFPYPLLGSFNPGPSYQTPYLHQLIVDSSLRPHSTATPTGSRPCNRPRCKICPIHHPANSFTSSRTNVTYPISTPADRKSMNLIYQLQCTECNAFYIGETCRSLSDRMNGNRFTTMVSNPDLPVAIHTQSHQNPFPGMPVC